MTYAHINHLKTQKISEGIELKNSIKELKKSLSPVSIVKQTLNEISEDKKAKLDLAKIGLNIGADFIIDKVVGRGKSIKGFLSSIILEKFQKPSLIKTPHQSCQQ